MSLFPIVDGRARFDASGNVASDRYAAGIRFTQEGAARSQISAGTNFNQGIPMSESGQVSLVDASSGLPADVVWLSGLPISGNRVCISNKPVSVVSSGIPYDSAGAVAATVAPITTLPTLDLVFAGTATDPLDAATTADDTLGLNFVSQAYQIAAQYAVWGTGGLQQVNFADIVTFTRASTATYFDSTGTLQTATTNTARFDYNPSTLAAQGLLIEEQRTNSIRNNTMQGAVAGTPGTLPTNWSDFYSGTGVTRTIVGTGTENGITYVDIRLSGTPSATATYAINMEGATASATVGQTWTVSTYYKLQAGSTSNLNVRLGLIELNSGAGYLTEQNFAVTTPTGSALSTQRASGTRTLASATVAFVQPNINFTLTASAAIDITLRIGLPQLEQGAFATSVIPTTTTALTRSADVASVNTLAPWFNSTAGTLYAEYSRFGAVNFQACAVLGEATFQNSISLGFGSGAPSNNNRFDVNASGSSQASITLLTNPALNTVAKTAGAYATNDFAGTANGAVPGTDTSGTVPSGIAVLSIGCNSALNGGFLNGYLRRITYYPRRLPNADLQTITA